ncbi:MULTISPECIES: hypothetical protein [Psychrobacter]|uniref:hypothetical protein n=1 Tax=Psychrobacter TaxID=497 RepID=UPI001D0D9D58|nr:MULTISPECIES: hypothetical protein [Psychrobacter]
MSHITTYNELVQAVMKGEQELVIGRSILVSSSFTLAPNVILRGEAQENGELPTLSFSRTDGIALTKNNRIKDLNIQADASHRAIYNILQEQDLGSFQFENLSLVGQLSFITRPGTKSAKVSIKDVDIIACDARHYPEQPQKYGVNVLQGALTVYNFNSEKDSRIDLTIDNITIGRKNAPVLGSGLFVSGFGDEGGTVVADRITTGAVYSNGKLPFGVPDIITAAIFIVYGATVKQLTHNETIVTYGVSDMVLDTWGHVDNWLSEKDVISYGPSGIGFVNFGTVGNFVVKGDVKTYGLGARGYNQYDGTVDNIEFGSIETFGDGSIGIQLSRKIGKLTVHRDVITHGGEGQSLVKGVLSTLKAIGLSVKEGGEAEQINIGGNLETQGNEVNTVEVNKGGKIHAIQVGGGIVAKGEKSKRLDIEDGADVPESLKEA